MQNSLNFNDVMTLRHGIVILALGCGVWARVASGQQANQDRQTRPAPAIPNAPEQKAPLTNGPLTVFDLERQAELQTKVSFDARRLPLTDLLSELEKQSGTQLSDAPGAPFDVQVTARVREMPLWDVLGALSRLYGIAWSRTGERSFAFRFDLDQPHRQLLRLGTGNSTPRVSQAIRPDWAAEIMPHIRDTNALRSERGVPLKTLPEALQHLIREKSEPRLAGNLLRNYRRFLQPRLMGPHYALRIEDAKNGQPNHYRLAIVDPNGRIIGFAGYINWEPPAKENQQALQNR